MLLFSLYWNWIGLKSISVTKIANVAYADLELCNLKNLHGISIQELKFHIIFQYFHLLKVFVFVQVTTNDVSIENATEYCNLTISLFCLKLSIKSGSIANIKQPQKPNADLQFLSTDDWANPKWVGSQSKS